MPKSALLGSTKIPTTAPLPPSHEQPQTAAPSRPAQPPVATISRPHPRARRGIPRRRDSNGERGDDGEDGGEAPDAAPKRRDHHGDRTTPPPAQFSLAELPDDALLTQREIAAVLRVAISTVETWRRRGHALKWATVGSGLIRYYARDLREFLASGTPRKRKPKPTAPAAAPPQRRARARSDAAALDEVAS